MKIKINEHLICISPYVSARWTQVAFIQTEEDPVNKSHSLLLHLNDGKVIRIPNLDKPVIDIAFYEHLRYLEQNQNKELLELKDEDKFKFISSLIQQVTKSVDLQLLSTKTVSPTLLFGGESIEALLQHIPEQKDCPTMPREAIEKMIGFIKTIMGSDLKLLLKPEPHCNCLHCQIARITHESENEEVVTEEDLSFRDWDIIQSGEQLYTVTNPLDRKEQYNVYLGNPVGCTCGNLHCEHIKTVLYN
ncbi:MAG: hypothetical protein RSB82_03210 [Victivallaceae bacterium]